MCEHGFIGACAECDGCGQQPEVVEEHEGLLERRREFSADEVVLCADCGKPAEGNVTVETPEGGFEICDRCHHAQLLQDAVVTYVKDVNVALRDTAFDFDGGEEDALQAELLAQHSRSIWTELQAMNMSGQLR